MAKVIRRETEIEVRVGLAADEREPLTKELLNELDEIDKLRIEAADTQATYRATIKEHVEKSEGLRVTLDQGRPEMRKVEAIYDFGAGIVKYKDKETGKYLKDKQREVTDEDRQLIIGDEEGTDPDPTPPPEDAA